MQTNAHISVCICTYKRPELLEKLLDALKDQDSGGLFTYSVVVVDNDHVGSAHEIVCSFMRKSSISISYHIEPEQNIALARNRAVENATGEFVAFIDDDEFPIREWLRNLYTAWARFKSDGVLGPVKPHYAQKCPAWIARSRLCERQSHPTGTIMRITDTRTGNVLLRREIFDDPDNRFDPQFGRTGGEDVWFFVKVVGQGRSFVWCDEAPVYETVPPERWKESYYLKRALRKGGLTGEEVRTKGFPHHSIIRVVGTTFLYLMMLPPVAFLGKAMFMRVLVKSAYNVAYLLGYSGRVLIRLRED